MKERYRCALGLMLALALMSGLGCDSDNSVNINPSIAPGPAVIGSGIIVQETRSATGATGVDLSGVANLTIEQGAPEELILQTDDNLMERILTEVQGGILVIRKDPTVTLQPSRSQRTGIEAHLTLSSISSITLSGVGGITVPGLTTTQLELSMSGVGDIDIFNLDTQTLDVFMRGVGGIAVAGQADNQLITHSALGNYNAADLISAAVDVEITQNGSATVQVSTTLNANITGGGSVFYHGSPVVTRTGTGTGSVVQLSP